MFRTGGRRALMRTTGLNVLVVEDEALVAMMAEAILVGMGFRPSTARTGADALAQFETLSPRLVLIDVGLPDLRGDDLALQLRARDPELPIVMASGYDEAELASRFADDPYVAVLTKPYNDADVARAARALGFVSA